MNESQVRLNQAGSATLSRVNRPAAFVATEQGGLERAPKGNAEGLIATASVHNRIATLTGITGLAKELRGQLLSTDDTREHHFAHSLLGDSPKILEQFAEAEAKLRLLVNSIDRVQDDNQREILREQATAWQSTISETAQSFCESPDQQSQYTSSVNAHEERLKQSSEYGKTSYEARLQRILVTERAVSLIGHALHPQKGEQFAEQVLDEFLEAAWTINAVKVLRLIQEPGSQDEGIDLPSVREEVLKLKEKAAQITSSSAEPYERETQLAELDLHLQNLLTHIANKIVKDFDFGGFGGSTSLTDVIEKHEAICAGRVNMLLVVAQYLGLNARADAVNVGTMGGENYDHVFIEVDTFSDSSNKKLVIESTVPKDQNALLFTIHNTGRTSYLQSVDGSAHEFIRFNPYTGEEEVWGSDSKYSYFKFISPDKKGDGVINFSFIYNTTNVMGRSKYDDPQIFSYLVSKYIELSPYDIQAYSRYIDANGAENAVIYLESLRSSNPRVFWKVAYKALSWAYIKTGDVDKALEVFDNLKTQDIHAYYANLHNISNSLFDPEKGREEVNRTINEYLITAREANPELFVSERKNIIRLLRLNLSVEDEARLLEDYMQYNPSDFWREHTEDPAIKAYSRLYNVYRRLRNMYSSQPGRIEEIDAKQRSFYESAKQQQNEFYISELLAEDPQLQQMAPDDKIAYMRQYSEVPSFYANTRNVTLLVDTLVTQNRIEEACEILSRCQEIKEDTFWGDIHSFWLRLANLYVKLERYQEAMSVYEGKKLHNPDDYWKKKYSGLADVYEKLGEHEKAEALLNELIAQHESSDLTDYSTVMSLGGLYERRGKESDMEAAISLYEKQLMDDPSATRKVLAGLRIASLLAERGETERAAERYQRLLELAQSEDILGVRDYLRASIFSQASERGITLSQS